VAPRLLQDLNIIAMLGILLTGNTILTQVILM